MSLSYPLFPIYRMFFTVSHKSSKLHPLSKKQKKSNRKHSSLRIVAEHAIGKMKIWNIVSDRLRHSQHNHSLALKNIAGLHNLMFA